MREKLSHKFLTFLRKRRKCVNSCNEKKTANICDSFELCKASNITIEYLYWNGMQNTV